jgi:trbL/virB6 plasmid conjugal transfer protein
MRRNHWPRLAIPIGIALLCTVGGLLLNFGAAFAAAPPFDTNIGLGDDAFQSNLNTMTSGMVYAVRIISAIMVALAGLMVAFNVESANKSTWNIILGIGLALNFGTLLMSVYAPYFEMGDNQAAFDYKIHLDADKNTKWYDFLQPFTSTYIAYTKTGAVAVMPVAAKLLVILTAISASVKIAFDLISGDKMKFLAQTLLETGLYLFLILNWYGHGIDIMGSLCSGFQSLGYHAGGYTNGEAHPGSLIENAVTIFSTGYAKAQSAFSIWSPISGLFAVLCLVIMFILLILAGIELLMAKIEFFTVAMLTIPLIPFVALPQTKFLFERALGAMFNLAVKVCIISFLSAMASKILTDYCEEFAKLAESGDIIGNIPVLIQMVVVSLLLYLLIKKIPALVQGLLSGSPSLDGASMTQTAKNVTNTAVQAGAAVASGGTAMAANMAKGAVAGYASGGGGVAGIARAGLGAINSGAGTMLTAANRGSAMAYRSSDFAKAVKSGTQAAQKMFRMTNDKTATGMAKSGLKSGVHGVATGIANTWKAGATGVQGVATVARDVARDVQRYVPI